MQQMNELMEYKQMCGICWYNFFWIIFCIWDVRDYAVSNGYSFLFA